MTTQSNEVSAPTRPRIRILVEVECDQELVPGFGHNPMDFAEAAAQRVESMLACYNPTVITTGVEYM